MEMSNEEAIEWIETLVETMLHETNVGPFPDSEYQDEVYKALDMAINTMHKYQKIQDIYERFQKEGSYYHHMAWLDVMEVVEDGDN